MVEQVFGSSERPEGKEERKAFVAEIAALRDEETKHRETAHFLDAQFDVQELAAHDLDREVYEAAKNGTIDEALLKLYRDEVMQSEVHKLAAQQYSTRVQFLAYINNLATPIFGRRELDAARQQKRSKKPKSKS